jgi:hypothetical protein
MFEANTKKFLTEKGDQLEIHHPDQTLEKDSNAGGKNAFSRFERRQCGLS